MKHNSWIYQFALMVLLLTYMHYFGNYLRAGKDPDLESLVITGRYDVYLSSLVY